MDTLGLATTLELVTTPALALLDHTAALELVSLASTLELATTPALVLLDHTVALELVDVLVDIRLEATRLQQLTAFILDCHIWPSECVVEPSSVKCITILCSTH